jgi:hypothetical protein
VQPWGVGLGSVLWFVRIAIVSPYAASPTAAPLFVTPFTPAAILSKVQQAIALALLYPDLSRGRGKKEMLE